MKKLVILSLMVWTWLSVAGVNDVDARPQYKSVIDDMDPETDPEKDLQKSVKTEKCNFCHDKKDKKIRTEFGEKLHEALGDGDKDNYKFNKNAWKKANGKYSDEAIKMLRDAINKAAEEKQN